MLSHLLNNFEIQRFQNEIYNKIQYSKKVLYVKFNTSGEKRLVISTSCARCGSNNDKTFKQEEYIKILNILGITDNINE